MTSAAGTNRHDEAVARILEGAVDLHIHTAPSPFPRRIDVVDAARSAQEAGFKAIVAKSHHHATVIDVLAVQQRGLQDLSIQVYGGIALNSAVGGLNPHAVDQALKMGGRAVWFPTVAASRHIEHHHANPDMKFPKVTFRLMDEAPTDVIDRDGRLLPSSTRSSRSSARTTRSSRRGTSPPPRSRRCSRRHATPV